MTTEEEWMATEGFSYVEDQSVLLEVEIEYEEEEYKSLDYTFRSYQFPSDDDWAYYTNGYD